MGRIKLKFELRMATTICVDLLNYSDDFFNFPRMSLMQTSDFEENLKYGRKKISEFVSAAQQSGYKIIGFIDKAIATGEALEKWFDRRTKQMESGHMNVFVKLPVIVGSIFSSLGVEVHYSTIDNDDTIAAFAHKLGGGVLSRDQDFFRNHTGSYTGVPPYPVYFDFTLSQNRLTLNRHGGPSRYRIRPSPRKILDTLPDTKKSFFFLESNLEGKLIMRGGCGSNLTQLENPLVKARKLRQAVYSRLNCGPVLETFACWNKEERRAVFPELLVKPDINLDSLVSDPVRAFHEIFGSEKREAGVADLGWKNHLFCQAIVIAELCAWGTGSDLFDNLEILRG